MKHHRDTALPSIRQHARSHGALDDVTYGEWYALRIAYGEVCLACGSVGDLVPDHVVALARGGANLIENIQPLCESCNSVKQTKLIDYRCGRQIVPISEVIIPEYIDDGFIMIEIPPDVWRSVRIAAANTGEKVRHMLDRLCREEWEKVNRKGGRKSQDTAQGETGKTKGSAE